MKRVWTMLALPLLVAVQPVWAGGVEQVQVVGNEITARVNVAGVFQASLKITFEQVVGLSANAVDLEALQINPTNPALLSRLPDPTKVSPPGQFPILLSVNPSSSSSLTFTGAYQIELSTSNLAFHPSFRLFTAPTGGSFEDITNFAGVGSYRVRGMSGEFSDFLIVLDLRSSATTVQEKFNGLQQLLVAHAAKIDAAVLQSLQDKLDSARQSYELGFNVEAAADMEAFYNQVKANEGTALPNVYRANDPNTVNVGGALRRQAATLIFSIRV